MSHKLIVDDFLALAYCSSMKTMKIEDHIQYWLDSADNDLDAAKSLFLSKKYDWCLFIGHLVLEKILKAFYVLNNENKIPPKTHNLLKIVRAADVSLSKEQIIFLDEVNDFNLEVRYPEYKREFYKICTREFAEKYFQKIEEFASWLKSRIK
ncbi:MAG: HEPN domain-containing protein [Deltaproteobacteria bacterium]|nr:HEPN domain-containing protein [Deltaproteobacteria bacterium]